uniref:Beta-hexosaminidase n=1 Tax=Trichobilharzia regenti TaxID=157069 RepID=A0AA85KBT8_TRIRE|nr:unnamed protein product [Trichobilharzia regenti]
MKMTYLISSIFLIISYYAVNSLVPRPLKQEMGESLCSVANLLSIEHDYPYCYILNEALKVFDRRLLHIQRSPQSNDYETVSCSIKVLSFIITSGCDESQNKLWPSEHMDESHKISILDGKIGIESNEVWGVLHALQTVIQLVYRSESGALVIHEQNIEDSPQYGHRGFLLDTADHYISVDGMEKFIDIMAVVKMNVLHWHMTDDTAFPYDSFTYPELSRKGAYDPQKLVYENGDVQRLLQFARQRGIRVIVEFDTPAHTKSWEKGYPGLRTECYKDGKPTGETGPFNPANGTTFKFLKAFFKEVTSVFPETFVHLGGNDVLPSCWKSNPDILKFMEENNFGSDFGKLESYYFDQLTEAIQSVQPEGHSITPVIWDGVYIDGYRPSKATVIQVWNGGVWTELVKWITSAGYRVIMSSCWLFTGVHSAKYWMKYYECNPTAFNATEEERNLVVGGEAVVYTEYLDKSNLIMHSWPEGAAVAERLWSRDPFNTDEFEIRLNELRCHLRYLGFNAKPLNALNSCL